MSRVRGLPLLVVEAGGSPLPHDASRLLAAVRVQQRLSLPDLCELTFEEEAWASVAALLAPGSRLRLTLAAHTQPLFSGEVTAVEHIYGPGQQREVRIRAYDLLHRLRKRQSLRAFVDVTVADLARQLVIDLGIVVTAEESGPLWPRVVQHRQPDLELLAELAERCGLYLTLRGDRLHLITLAGTGEAVSLSLGRELHEARVEVNGDPACRSVTARGWDPRRVEMHQATASGARSSRQVFAAAPPSGFGSSGERYLPGEPSPDDRHAEAFAQAELDRRVAREVTLWGLADGDPRLRPGAAIDVAGVADALAGRYVLTAVTHTVDDRLGFVSELSTAPPAPRQRPRGASIAPGIVTQVDDPDGLGRVRVSLPTYGGVETEWLGVLSAGAGPGKGLVMLPDTGDRVLVLFSHEDPAQAVVLGGLYGPQSPPDPGVDGGAVRRYTLRTAGGHYVQFDDGLKTVRLQDGNGSYLEFSPESVYLHAEAPLFIEAPGRRVLIRGQAIDFERA